MSAKIDHGGFAFPHQFEDVTGNKNWMQSQGMSLRDWFAGQALCATAEIHNGIGVDPRGTAIAAYQFADAMLAARKAGAE